MNLHAVHEDDGWESLLALVIIGGLATLGGLYRIRIIQILVSEKT